MIRDKWHRCNLKQLLFLFVVFSIAFTVILHQTRRGRAVKTLEQIGAKIVYQSQPRHWIDTFIGYANLVGLSSIELEGMSFGDEHVYLFDSLADLQFLSLADTKLTDQGVSLLPHMPGRCN